MSGIELFVSEVSKRLNLSNPGLRVVLAALGVITTKHIFESGLHYPFHLLSIHVSAVLISEAFSWSYNRFSPNGVDVQDQNQLSLLHGDSISKTVLAGHCLRALCLTGSLLSEYQAIFHSTTLPGLAMLLTLHWIHVPLDADRARNSQLRKCMLLSLVFLGGIALILVFDRKISEPGLKMSMLCILLAGVARILDTEIRTSCGDMAPSPRGLLLERLMTLLFTLILTLIMIRRYEHPIWTPVSPASLDGILVLNVLFAVAALRTNWSLFRQIDPPGVHSGPKSIPKNLIPILFVGVITVVDFLSSSPIQTSVWQYIGFSISTGASSLAECRPDDSFEGDKQNDGDVLLFAGDIETSGHLDYDVVAMCDQKENRLRHPLWVWIFLCSALLLSIPAIIYWTAQPVFRQRAISGTGGNMTRSMDFVVSRFDEPADQIANQLIPLLELSNLQDRTMRVMVYSTGEDDSGTFKDELQHFLQLQATVAVEHRENIGREGAAFLHHINTKWDVLADQTLFMQAHLHDRWHVRRRLQSYLVPETGFLALSDLEEYCSSCGECWDHSTWSESSDVLEAIYSRAYEGESCKSFALTYRGQFVASRKRIHGQGIALFQDLLRDLTDSGSKMHSESYIGQHWLPQKVDSMNSPLFGYTLERLWGTIMRCSDVQLASTCPSMLSASMTSALGIALPTLEDCQCLDDYENPDFLL